VVTFNYRAGLFGFLASQDVKDDGDLNAGLLDQRKAITWVHNHISAFGGDPERVTLFGTSAGAGGVLLHTLAYGGENTSKPLFSAALSADPFVPEIFPYQRFEFQYQEILNATNCSSLECLRHLPTDSLLAANINRPFPGQTTSPLFYFSPCVDGIFFPDLPSKLLAQGRFQRVPLLQGTVTDEGSIFALTANNTDVDQLDDFLSAQFPDLDTDGIDAQYSYVPLNTTSQAYYNRASLAYGDVSYSCYGLSFAAAFAAANLPVYSWLYNVIDPVNTEVGIGVFHTWEVGAVWGPGNAVNIAAPAGADSYTNINKGIVPVVQAYWTSFARAHDPNVWRLEGSPEWKTWGPGQRLKIQTNSTAMEMVDRQQIENCEFWAARNSQVYH
jgi:carboxylesterase type B